MKFYIQQSINERNKILKWTNGYDFQDIDKSGNIDEYNIYTNRQNIGSITHMIKYHVSAIESVTEYANHIMSHYKNGSHYTWRNFWAVVFGFNYNLKDSCDKIKEMRDSLLETNLMVEPCNIMNKHKKIHKKLECVIAEYNKYKKQEHVLEENIKQYIKKKTLIKQKDRLMNEFNKAKEDLNGNMDLICQQMEQLVYDYSQEIEEYDNDEFSI